MERDELISSRIEDCIRRSEEGYYVVATKFLDAHEQAIAKTAARKNAANVLFYGGYEDAERRIMLAIPRDLEANVEDSTDYFLKALHIEVKSCGRKLGHRDYLGSVLSLGLDRSVIGDILVRDDGADMIVLPEIADFLEREYTQVAHSEIKTSICEISELDIPEKRVKIITDTVPSLRLDTIIQTAFKISRGNAAEAIRKGLVSVNHMENLKIDSKVAEGDTLVLRGKGKAKLSEIGGESKKGRVWIKVERYED